MNPDFAGLLRVLMPELSLVIGALLVLGIDLVGGRRRPPAERLRTSVSVGGLALLVAAYFTAATAGDGAVFGDVFMVDALGAMTRLGVLTLALLAVAMMPGTTESRHSAEFVAVTLFATVGLSLMAIAQQLLLAFLAIELASLSLYILTGFDKTRPESAEAALKYFLFGGMSAAFLLFGFSLLYGLTGSLELPRVAAALQTGGGGPLLTVAVVMVIVAFGFKAAAAPFHLWAPDVYQGAPAAAAALIASASKLAGVAIFTRLLWPGLGAAAGSFDGPLARPGWLTAVALVSAASLLLGNIGALAQSNVRRLLAYSAIGHAGVMLLGVMVRGYVGAGPVFYYAATYGIATVGAFGVVGAIERAGAPCQKLTDLAGLYRRSPVLAGCLLVFLLSLAGIPPLAGFFAKFSVFAAALQIGGVTNPFGWLALLGIAMSAVALYYYLVALKQALVTPPPLESGRLAIPTDVIFTLVVAASMLVVLGLAPSALLRVF